MSTLLHPVGPQGPGVYWVRRALVLLVVLALLLGLRWLLFGRSSAASPDASPTQGQSPAASPSVPATTPASSPSSSPSTKPSTKPSTSPSPSSTGTPACAVKDIKVTASTDAASYPAGSTPRLRMRIQNAGTKACTRDVGAAQNELIITSGAKHIWSSDDCSPGGSAQVATLQPGASYSVSVTWLGRLSQKGCPANQPLATKGSYTLVGRNGDVSSAGAAFSLT